MEEKDIHDLFLSVVGRTARDSDAVREVFSILVRTTLAYRDQLLSSRGIIVTVEDVRTALGWLVPALSTGELPETDDSTRLDLLKSWLDALKTIGNPGGS